MATKSISIRIEEEMLKRIGFVSEYEGRSVNSHILVLIRENIELFEKERGKITEFVMPEKNVKPRRKD